MDNVGFASRLIKREAKVRSNRSIRLPSILKSSISACTDDFGTTIEMASYDRGYWDDSTPVSNAGNTGFYDSS